MLNNKRKGFVKTGEHAGKVGYVERCTIEGFDDLYEVTFVDGTKGATYIDNIAFTVNIVIKDWHYTCLDGCCDDWGTDLYINGKLITQYFDMNEEIFKNILNALGVDYEFSHIHDEEV